MIPIPHHTDEQQESLLCAARACASQSKSILIVRFSQTGPDKTAILLLRHPSFGQMLDDHFVVHLHVHFPYG